MSDEVLTVYYVRSRTMADGSLRIEFDIQPADSPKAFSLFHEPGAVGALARIHDEAAQSHHIQTTGFNPDDERPYGKQAQDLFLSGFFLNMEVAHAIGTDNEYQAWCRTQPCAVCGGMDHDPDTGKSQNQFAHLRRANEAGTAFKPPYRGLPMCARHHRAQHNTGEGTVGGREALERSATEHLRQWCWGTLKRKLGYRTFAQIPPEVVRGWAEKNNVERYLPEVYRGG